MRHGAQGEPATGCGSPQETPHFPRVLNQKSASEIVDDFSFQKPSVGLSFSCRWWSNQQNDLNQMFKRIEIESLKAEIAKINEAHWSGDYNDACSRPDYTLRRRLANRITPLLRDALALGMVVSSECGPCAKFGFQLKD